MSAGRLNAGRGREPGRRPRADAKRNYERLLSAAKGVFQEHGADAPLDAVARRAGVGNATMYRHFPQRRDLLVAVYAAEVTALCTHGSVLLAEEPPGQALFEWLRAFIAHVATKRELALALAHDGGGQRTALYDDWHESMHATASALLSRAQESGAVQAELRVEDLLALANGIAMAGTSTEHAERLLQISRRGLEGGERAGR